jgi:TIR domain
VIAEEAVPKIFISYRWSSPEHIAWVLNFATSLRGDGIDVKLDRWDLRPGQDALAFMESMVVDETIQKVLIISDKGYAERANDRSGGVGIEAQIISPKIYESTSQEKFAAILLELDNDGRPVLPSFLASRIFFDFTTDDSRAQNYEEVVRWIFGKPIDLRPPIGVRPQYLEGELRSPIALAHPISRGGLDRSPATISSAFQILETISDEAIKLVLDVVNHPDQLEEIYQSILRTVTLREEVYRAIKIVLGSGDTKSFEKIHGCFEGLLKYWDYSPMNRSYSPLDNDALRFFTHDCFVGFISLAIDNRQFSELSEFLTTPFYRPKQDGKTGEAVSYTYLQAHLDSLDYRNREKNLNRLSLHADLIAETHERSVVTLEKFLEADLILYLRGLIAPRFRWYPVSAIWFSRSFGATKLFARAQSSKFYNSLKPLLLDIEPNQLRATLAPYISGEQKILRVDYNELPVATLLNLDNLATSG